MTMWMVRAGRGNRLFEPFLERGVVAIGWEDLGDLSRYGSRDAIAARLKAMMPDVKEQAHLTSAGMLYRFCHELAAGDRVITYNQQRRVYAVGTIEGPYRHDPGFDPVSPNVRPVRWEATALSRDRVSASTKNTLGSVLTLFRLPRDAEAEVLEVMRAGSGAAPAADAAEGGEQQADETTILHDLENKSLEAVKDRIVRLGPYDMQDVVAGLLRAMGYKTRVSQAGPDRGRDIVASPDGFGFEDPRIVVEIKHQPSTAMSSHAIRSFLGGRHPGDKGLYVSTGGFTKDAMYEAERANIPVTLMDLDALVSALLDNYAAMDTETQRLLPLKRIFWPLG